MARRYYSSTAVATTLSAPINNAVTSIDVTSLTGYPVSTPWTAVIDPDAATEEVVEVTNVAGTTLTVTRGVDGTTGQSHSAGAVFRHSVSARDFDEANAFVNGGGVAASVVDAAGDLIVGSAADTVGRLALGNNGYVLTVDTSGSGVNKVKWSAVESLPTQTGNSGKLLTTNGTAGSWTDQVTSLNLIAPEEKANVVASAATGTINLDALTASIWYYTTNASANHTLNVRGNSGTTLSSLLAVGDSMSVVWMVTNGATPYRPTVFQVDGSSVTPKWVDGVAPTAGNASSIDMYTLTIIKTAATPTYVVLAGLTKFA